MKLVSIIGARPNYMKMAALWHAGTLFENVNHVLVHTGQHYDSGLDWSSFRDILGVPPPHYALNNSGNTVERWGQMVSQLSDIIRQEMPHFVLVYGDVDSTLMGALAAKKAGVRLVHVEAGLRSFDAAMPEERNRFVTDHLSDLLMVSEPSGIAHLSDEGFDLDRVFMVGNTMMDTLQRLRPDIVKKELLVPFDLARYPDWILCTLHRPENVDDAERLRKVGLILADLAKNRPVWLPLHPRTRSALERFGLLPEWNSYIGLYLTDALNYLSFHKALSLCGAVLTDSGGVQEEACFWQKPCYTWRQSTERPLTVELGWNSLVNDSTVRNAIDSFGAIQGLPLPVIWQGGAAERILTILLKYDRPS